MGQLASPAATPAPTSKSTPALPTPQTGASLVPLCVDLDGTLLKTDMLEETFIRFLKARPWSVLILLVWLLSGRATLKRRLGEKARFDPALLPYREDFVSFLKSERARGRRLILATAGDRTVAEAIASHLKLFDEVLSSDGVTNLKSEKKRELLVARYGEGGYVYAGNSGADLEVWRSASAAILVNTSARVAKSAESLTPIESTFPRRARKLSVFTRAIRVQQWAKNILVFLPLITSHTLLDQDKLIPAIFMFVAFSLCASSVYVLNDLLDLESDRAHPLKKRRPFASGELPISAGILIILILLLGTIAVASRLPVAAATVLAGYYASTLAYSFLLKRKALVDVFVLAALYTARVLGGHFAAGLQFSTWLLAFILFFFLSLAFAKRYSEIHNMKSRGEGVTKGRNYRQEDLPVMAVFGVASGFIAALVLALYVGSTSVVSLYRAPLVLWMLAPIQLYWICRVWLLAHRGELHEDPIEFAIRDWRSYLLAVITAATVLIGMFADRIGIG